MEIKKHLIYKEDVLAMAWLADECEVVTASDIEDMKAVDAVKVDHGHWKIDTSYMPFLSTCSECGALYTIDGAFDWDYCPDCGSKMDGGNTWQA